MVSTAENFASVGDNSPTSSVVSCGTVTATTQTLSDLSVPWSAEDFASVGGDSPTSSVASSGASAYDSAASLPGAMVLPRADVLILGGDLAYPNPSNETYEKRLFR